MNEQLLENQEEARSYSKMDIIFVFTKTPWSVCLGRQVSCESLVVPSLKALVALQIKRDERGKKRFWNNTPCGC